MKNSVRSFVVAAAILSVASASAQSSADGKYAVKAGFGIGLGKAVGAKSDLPDLSTKSSASDFGFDFGYKFWEMRQHSLQANVGLGFGSVGLTSDLSRLDYHYNAPAAADMDQDTYIRYYELSNLHQKASVSRFTIPLYVNYRYKINQTVSVHALLGFKFGFNVSSKISDTSGSAFSYGVYPQYDDLMIDASYMNEFGNTTLGSGQALKPETNGLGVSLLAGIGAEVSVWGPLAADITFGYEAGMSNMFKPAGSNITSFDAQNAPVTYTVADGQKMKPLSSFLSGSKLSRLSLGIALIYRF